MFCSRKLDQNKRISRELDAFLREENRRESNCVKVLLLGTGESGKTTIIKQMRIIHINGFSDQEKREKISNIRQNVHESIYTLVKNMEQLVPPVFLENEESQSSAQYVLSIGFEEPAHYSNIYYDHVHTLWKDWGVKAAIKRANEYQLLDCASYFLDRIDKIRDPTYIPSVQDMLHYRTKTVSISKIEFSVPYRGQKIPIWMYDVGGQRGERRKWISVFEGIQAVLFIIAASDFDMTLREDHEKNRLKEAFQVFKDMFWSRFLRKSGKIVFLNKQDKLQEKIENGHRVVDYFPDFSSYQLHHEGVLHNDYNRAKHFIEKKIRDIAATKPQTEIVTVGPGMPVEVETQEQEVYIHFTVATDTNNVKRVFSSVKDIILIDNLRTVGIF